MGDYKTMTEWKLNSEKLTGPQIETLDQIIDFCKQAHKIDVEIRIGGQWLRYEADWIKHLEKSHNGS